METVTLYHGTSDESADALLARGWQPNMWPSGGHCGQPKFLYLTTTPENAAWYANEKGSERVVAVTVPVSSLLVDPEDGMDDTVAGELLMEPGNLVLREAMPAEAFADAAPAPVP
jgi:hypothetical protein